MNNTTKRGRNRWRVKILLIVLSLLMISVPTTLAQEDSKNFVVFDGQEGKKYDTIFVNRLVEVDGKLAYSVEDEDNRFIVFDGQELGKEHDLAQLPVEVNDKLAYAVSNYGTGESFIKWGARKKGQEYDSVSHPTEVGGKLAYTAIDLEENQRFVVWGGEKTDRKHNRSIGPIIDVDGQPAYEVNGENFSFIIHKGTRSRNVDIVWDLIDVDGKLAYSASKNDSKMVVFDGQKVSEGYNLASFPAEVNGKLAYQARENGRSLIVFDGEEIGKSYEQARMPTEVAGELAYRAMNDDGNWFVVWGGEKISNEYDLVKNLVEVDGKPAYIAREDGKSFVVWDGKRVSKKYKQLGNVIEVDGQPAYLVTDRGDREESENETTEPVQDKSEHIIERNIGTYNLSRTENYTLNAEGHGLYPEVPGFRYTLEYDYLASKVYAATYNKGDNYFGIGVQSFDSREDMNKYVLRRVLDHKEEKDVNGNTVYWHREDTRDTERRPEKRPELYWTNGNKIITFTSSSWGNESWEEAKNSVKPLIDAYLEKHPSDLDELEGSIGGHPDRIIEKNLGDYKFKFSVATSESIGPADNVGIEEDYMGFYRRPTEQGKDDTARARVISFEDREEAHKLIRDLGPGYNGTKTINGNEVMDYKYHYRWLHDNKIIRVSDPLKESDAPLHIVEEYMKKYPSDLRTSSEESDIISTRLEKGWNLVSNGILAGYTITQGSEIKRTDIGAIFHYDSQKNRYVRILPDPKRSEQEIEELAEEGYATWVYSRESGKLTFEKGKPLIPIQNRDLYPGWNLVSIENSIVGKTNTGDNIQLKDIMGSCKIQETYLYDPDTGWDSLSLQAPMGKGLKGKGMLVKVQNRCSLEKPQKEIKPPELPRTEPTPPPKNP